ncbi:MAG: heat-inducible transcriptional repressor HrcA [Clostridia bacterium]
MELEDRKKKVLSVVVEEFIKTGEPVGSKAVMDKINVSVSSATIRNDMALLEDMGLLYQPHTSAGRVPSVEGYKLFVSKLMKTYELSKKEKNQIDVLLAKVSKTTTAITKDTVEIISQLTGCTAVAVAPASGGSLQMFEAFVAGKHLLAVLAVSATGVTKTKICVTDIEPNSENAMILSKILSKTFSGRSVTQISDELINIAKAEIEKSCPEFISLMPFIKEFINELCGYDVYVGGEEKLFDYPEFSNASKIQPFLSLLSRHDDILKIAQKNPSGIEVDILGDQGLTELKNVSMITSGMYMGSDNGIMCVFGPTRLDYAKVLAKMNYFTEQMSKIISELYLE